MADALNRDPSAGPAGPVPRPITRAEAALLASLSEARGRRETGLCLVEGAVLLQEALSVGCAPRLVALEGEPDAATADLLARAARAGAEVVGLDARAARRLSDREHAAGLIAAVPQPDPWVPSAPPAGPALVLALCGLQDPGNVGTLLRSARAFGATAVLLAEGSADAFAPKVVRASAGAALRVPVLRVGTASLPRLAVDLGLEATGAVAHAGEAGALPLPARCLLLLGHETRGLPQLPGLRLASVPHEPGVDSLNVAMAGSILAADWYRGARG